MYRLLAYLFFSFSWIYICSQNDSTYTRFTYPDGQVSSEGMLLDGKPEGYWKTYFPNGQLKSEGNRVGFQLDGPWIFYNEAGILQERIAYAKGRRNGITEKYKEGLLIERCDYVNDTLSGTCEEYRDSTLLREVPFADGKQNGKGYRFRENGEISEILYFKDGFLRNSERINRLDKLGRKQGPWKEFYPDRTMKMEGTYVDDEKNGLFTYYDERGEVSRVEKFENGILNEESAEMTVVDIRNEYYSNGAVRSSGSYKDGVKHGVHRDYDEDGVIIASRIYEYGKEVASGIIGRSGKIDGPWEEKYADGQIKEKGEYKDGLRVGDWKFYHPDGRLSQEGSFRKGKPHGEWRWYHRNGTLRREETYRNGREDGLSVEYDTGGKAIAKGSYVDGLKEGEWVYHSGDHVIKGSYVQGEKDGDWYGKYDNGKTQFKGEFQRGFAVGKHKFFFASGQLMQDGKYSSGRKNGEWRRFDELGEIILRSSFESGVERRLEGVKILPTYEELDID